MKHMLLLVRLTFLCFILAFPNYLSAQSFLSIKGRIVNAKDQSPLAYVHVGMPAQGIGTVSNELGEFEFFYPSYFQKEAIVISHIGYNEKILNEENKIKQDLVIQLSPSVNTLETVDVLSTKEPLDYYVQQAIKRLKKNYPTKLHAYQGFYRELKINAEDSTFTRLLEADISIQDRGIQTEIDLIKIAVNELRKSDDHTNYTESYLSVADKVNKRNKLYQFFNFDPVRTYINARGGHRGHFGKLSIPLFFNVGFLRARSTDNIVGIIFERILQ
ncbi:MAG: carboxypeptidase-like regulatory domain-containing protein [Bacteroidota bacterium]